MPFVQVQHLSPTSACIAPMAHESYFQEALHHCSLTKAENMLAVECQHLVRANLSELAGC
jgi:hypothetical protein